MLIGFNLTSTGKKEEQEESRARRIEELENDLAESEARAASLTE